MRGPRGSCILVWGRPPQSSARGHRPGLLLCGTRWQEAPALLLSSLISCRSPSRLHPWSSSSLLCHSIPDLTLPGLLCVTGWLWCGLQRLGVLCSHPTRGLRVDPLPGLFPILPERWPPQPCRERDQCLCDRHVCACVCLSSLYPWGCVGVPARLSHWAPR